MSIEQIKDTVIQTLSELGIHVHDINVGAAIKTDPATDDAGDLIEVPRIDLSDTNSFEESLDRLSEGAARGDANIMFNIDATVNQLAWTDRILRPELDSVNDQAEAMLGTTEDRLMEYMKEQRAKGVPFTEIEIPDHLLPGEEE